MKWPGRIGVGSVVLIACGCGASTAPSPVVPMEFLPATTLAANSAGDAGTSENYAGQSVVAAGSGRLYNLRFSWERWDGPPPYTHAPTAFGTLYVFDREYLGPPSGLSTSLPGFITRSTSTSSTEYIFPESVGIDTGRPYWFYTDARGAFLHSFYVSVYDAGDMYVTGNSTLAFHIAGEGTTGPWWAPVPIPREKYNDANFKLTGSLPKK